MRRPMCESKGAHIKWDQNWQTGFSIFGHIKHCWMDVTAYSRWRCPKGRGANIMGTMGEYHGDNGRSITTMDCGEY